jgi:phosphate butyryltransferase
MAMTFDKIWKRVDELSKEKGPQTMILLGACKELEVKAIKSAMEKGWITPIFASLGKNTQIEDQQNSVRGLREAEFISAGKDVELVQKAVACAMERRGFLMRGRVVVRDMLRTLLLKDSNFRLKGKLVSHIGFFENNHFQRMIMVTDGGVVIKPSLEQKMGIIKNAVEVAHKLGFKKPKVAMLTAVETVNLSMQVAIDYSVLSKMADRGAFGEAEVDGPLSFDVAISPRAAVEKKVKGEVAGNTDILLVPTIEVGNGLYKALFMFGNTRSAGLVVGGKFPIILTSRSQNLDSILNSIALAILLNRN